MKAIAPEIKARGLQLLSLGKSRDYVAEAMGVHKSTVSGWKKPKKEKSFEEIFPIEIKTNSPKTDPITYQVLVNYYDENPTHTLEETGRFFGVSKSTIWNLCQRYGITKKN